MSNVSIYQPIGNDLNQVPCFQLIFVTTGLDAILEHGDAKRTTGNELRRTGLLRHLNPRYVDAGPDLFFSEDPAASGAAAKAFQPGLFHFADSSATGKEYGARLLK